MGRLALSCSRQRSAGRAVRVRVCVTSCTHMQQCNMAGGVRKPLLLAQLHSLPCLEPSVRMYTRAEHSTMPLAASTFVGPCPICAASMATGMPRSTTCRPAGSVGLASATSTTTTVSGTVFWHVAVRVRQTAGGA